MNNNRCGIGPGCKKTFEKESNTIIKHLLHSSELVWGRDPFSKVDNIASPSRRRLFIIDPFIENFLPAQSPFVRSLVCSLILLLLIVTLRSDCHPTIKSILSRLLSHPQGKERKGGAIFVYGLIEHDVDSARTAQRIQL